MTLYVCSAAAKILRAAKAKVENVGGIWGMGNVKNEKMQEAVVFGRDLGLFLLQFVQQVVGRDFHFAEGEPLLAQIL